MEENKCSRPEDSVGFLLKELTNSMETHRNQNVKHLELTASQFEVLMFLHMNEDKTIYQTDIEKGLNRSNPTITGILNRLESKGFVERIPNEKDRRYKQIALTAKAKEIHAQGERHHQENEMRLTRGLSEEELKELRRMIRHLLHNVENDIEKDSKESNND